MDTKQIAIVAVLVVGLLVAFLALPKGFSPTGASNFPDRYEVMSPIITNSTQNTISLVNGMSRHIYVVNLSTVNVSTVNVTAQGSIDGVNYFTFDNVVVPNTTGIAYRQFTNTSKFIRFVVTNLSLVNSTKDYVTINYLAVSN